MKSREHQPFIKDNSQNVGFLNSRRVVYLPLSTNLLAGHLLLLTMTKLTWVNPLKFALRWPSSYVVLACSNGDPAVSGKVFKKVLPRMWSIAHPFSKCNTNNEQCNCSVCSYLDKYFSYYIIFILLVSPPLTTVKW